MVALAELDVTGPWAHVAVIAEHHGASVHGASDGTANRAEPAGPEHTRTAAAPPAPPTGAADKRHWLHIEHSAVQLDYDELRASHAVLTELSQLTDLHLALERREMDYVTRFVPHCSKLRRLRVTHLSLYDCVDLFSAPSLRASLETLEIEFRKRPTPAPPAEHQFQELLPDAIAQPEQPPEFEVAVTAFFAAVPALSTVRVRVGDELMLSASALAVGFCWLMELHSEPVHGLRLELHSAPGILIPSAASVVALLAAMPELMLVITCPLGPDGCVLQTEGVEELCRLRGQPRFCLERILATSHPMKQNADR